MGIQALNSRSKSDKHMKHVKVISSTKPITFITASSKDSQVASTSLVKNDSISDCTANVSVTSTSAPSQSIGSYFLKDGVSKAEIQWVMRTLMTQSSYHGCEKISNLFHNMFPDSKIAEVFALGPSKVPYVISHGLAPYYKDKVLQTVTPQDSDPLYFVACFDEAFNDVSNLKQLDVHLIYFDEHVQKTKRMHVHLICSHHLQKFKMIWIM